MKLRIDYSSLRILIFTIYYSTPSETIVFAEVTLIDFKYCILGDMHHSIVHHCVIEEIWMRESDSLIHHQLFSVWRCHLQKVSHVSFNSNPEKVNKPEVVFEFKHKAFFECIIPKLGVFNRNNNAAVIIILSGEESQFIAEIDSLESTILNVDRNLSWIRLIFIKHHSWTYHHSPLGGA